MVGLPVPDRLSIKSYKGDYSVEFTSDAFAAVQTLPVDKTQLIVDQKVFDLYRAHFEKYLADFKKVFINAEEAEKDIDQISKYVRVLSANGVKIDHTLVAVGGGITQDITCFLAATMFRGMSWIFVPTTLLAQADSCIGSKSSINVGSLKNLLGTFTPPRQIFLDVGFLRTLEAKDIASGTGEILKVHMIKGIEYFERAIVDLHAMKTDFQVLQNYIAASLRYKKELIELDEMDKGPRNVMNYGHSFGHAIESATSFGIPHGIAVTMGMDMANYQSMKMGRITEADFFKWHTALRENYRDFENVPLDRGIFSSSLKKDKKNTGSLLSLILVRRQGPIEKIGVAPDAEFQKNCDEFFAGFKNR
jgi:3-dehydroquinate synthase